MYEVPYEIVTPVTVKVETDFGNDIKESNETNNHFCRTGRGPCSLNLNGVEAESRKGQNDRTREGGDEV